MLETMASGLHVADRGIFIGRTKSFDTENAAVRAHFRDLARAALEALMVPTPEMIEAGYDHHMGNDMVSDESERRNAVEIFRAMIEKAMEG